MGRILANLGDELKGELSGCLPLLQDRLKNEITRLTTVKCLTRVANSGLRVDISPILKDSLPVLASFLRKNQRTLKLSTLTLLDTLVRNYNGVIQPTSLAPVLAELSPLISEADLHIAQLTMNLLTSVARLLKPCLGVVKTSSLPGVLRLTQSPLLQGAALTAMLEFFQALVVANEAEMNQQRMLDALVHPVMDPNSGASVHKQGRASIAKCVAAIVATQSPAEGLAVVNKFAGQLNNKSGQPHIQTFSLLAVAEIGKHM